MNGLVLCLDAANTKSYSGIGTVWTDLSGSGNTGTLTGGPTYSSANLGSIVFDGSNDYASIAHSSSLSFSSAFTISVWFYSASSDARNTSYLYLKGRTDVDNYNPLLYASGYYAWTGVNGRAVYNEPSGYISTNTWYNLTVSHTSGSDPIIYKNAVPSTSHTYSLGNGTYALGTNSDAIGINADIPRALVGTFDGKIANVQAYNRALSESEVSQNFNALRGRYGL